MSISAKTLGQMDNNEIIGFTQAIVASGAEPSESLKVKLRLQFEARGITADNMPRIRFEPPPPNILPEQMATNIEVRTALRRLHGHEEQALIPWKITASPHAHLDGETFLYQEISALMDEYLAYGELCTGCANNQPCIEEEHGGVHCLPVKMTMGLALLLLYDSRPGAYRAHMMNRPLMSDIDLAGVLGCSERTAQRQIRYASKFLSRCFAGQ